MKALYQDKFSFGLHQLQTLCGHRTHLLLTPVLCLSCRQTLVFSRRLTSEISRIEPVNNTCYSLTSMERFTKQMLFADSSIANFLPNESLKVLFTLLGIFAVGLAPYRQWKCREQLPNDGRFHQQESDLMCIWWRLFPGTWHKGSR